MTTRPKVTKVEVERCIRLIAARHAKAEDRHLERMPHDMDDVAGVLDYLRRYDGPHLPRAVRQADALDALTLNNHLWWEDRRRELWALKRGLELGQFLSTLGAQVGVTKQGAAARIERLEALLMFDRPDEVRLRERRRDDAADKLARAEEERWVRKHRDQLHEVVAALLEEAARHNPERSTPVDGEDEDEYRLRWEWLDELAKDAGDDAFAPTSMTLLSLAAAEVRTSDGVLALDSSRPHKVHHVLVRADELRCAFADLGKELRRQESTPLSTAAAPSPS